MVERRNYMKELFKNNYKKDKDLLKEVYFYLYFKRPFKIALHLLAIIIILYQLFTLIIYNYFDLFIITIWIIYLIIEIVSYKKMINLQFKRDLELNQGKILEVNTIITENSIKINASNNEKTELPFDKIKKGFQTKNLICLLSEAKLVYIFKKDSFTKGTSEEFIKFIKEKGIKL